MPASDSSKARQPSLERRHALLLLGLGGVALGEGSARAATKAGESASPQTGTVRVYANVAAMRQDTSQRDGDFARTLGFHAAGDGGEASYAIQSSEADSDAGGGASISLDSPLYAHLLPGNSVNYRMFGTVSDGQNDDGVQIKHAHQFARHHGLPIIQLQGEFWIKQTNEIPITTNVQWGNTIFHIDEKFNQKRIPRFAVISLKSSTTIQLDEAAKKSFLAKLRPGVQIISEMAPYKNCLISVADSGDQIGFRAGKRYAGQSWDREELFYVEEDGRILGDIAWTFKDYTSLRATPCDDSFLVIDGGGFYLSGDNPGTKYTGYYQNGFRIGRSRTKIQNQWVGLEPGSRDVSMEPRSGFYNFSHVYNTTLENIRLVPWEQNRRDPKKKVGAGTYGIGGSRMLNCTFRNVTAEGSFLHWGVFGTNLNKNFRIEKCRLNRVDVHFHCWNLCIQDSEIGLRGISVTGGGDLTIENTTLHNNMLVNFRSDFGAKWDGDIRIHNCTVVPVRDSQVNILSSSPSQFDFGYPVGCGRSVDIENLLVDFSHFPDSVAPVWLYRIAAFAKTEDGTRHFFPRLFSARNITVKGREQGIRLANIVEPYYYDLGREGGYDGHVLATNSQMIFENLHLENIPASRPGDPERAHFRLGTGGGTAYQDARALYPQIQFKNCPNLSVYLGGSAANVSITDSTVDRCTAAADGPLRGGLSLQGCRFVPQVLAAGEGGDPDQDSGAEEPIYAFDSELGTHLTNCTAHAPRIAGEPRPEQADRLGFIRPNKQVRYYQLNTALGNDLIKYFQENAIELKPEFIAMLRSHHGLEAEQVSGA
ncbi:hypothetical protein [Roseimaritima sediminicola]|uniref:hypothetical protein n=1 Tax=Roseimaritima sediminicola TaxID=2662066 RepID=UPI0012982659|nr:hypothetical protein [Roseimaritima sediminicola]